MVVIIDYLARLRLLRDLNHTVDDLWHLKVDLHPDASAPHLEVVIANQSLCSPRRFRLRHVVHLQLRSLPFLLTLLPPLPDLFGLAVLLVDLFLHPLQSLLPLLLPVSLLLLLVLRHLGGLAEHLLGPLIHALLGFGGLVLLE